MDIAVAGILCIAVLLVLLALAGCDDGSVGDAGPTAMDAAVEDAGSDAGSDAGTVGVHRLARARCPL